MHTSDLINNYKTQYTHKAEGSMLACHYYEVASRQTGMLDKNHCMVGKPSEANADEHPMATLNLLFSEQKDRQYMKLYSDFLLKWKQHKPHFSDFAETFVFENIKLVIDNLLSLNPSYVTFELTDEGSVFFQSLVNEKNVYLELYFANDVKEGTEAILNLCQNGVCVFAFGGTIENTFSNLSLRVLKNYWLKATSLSAYELPEQTFASTQF